MDSAAGKAPTNRDCLIPACGCAVGPTTASGSVQAGLRPAAAHRNHAARIDKSPQRVCRQQRRHGGNTTGRLRPRVAAKGRPGGLFYPRTERPASSADPGITKDQFVRCFNSPITVSSIGKISCAAAEIRAGIMQPRRDSEFKRQEDRFCANRHPHYHWYWGEVVAQPIRARRVRLLNRQMGPDGAPIKQCDPFALRQEIPFFQTLIGKQARRMRVGRKQCRKSGQGKSRS